MKVPDILLSGNHKQIALWREQKMLERTLNRRIDLFSKNHFKNLLDTNREKEEAINLIEFYPREKYEDDDHIWM